MMTKRSLVIPVAAALLLCACIPTTAAETRRRRPKRAAVTMLKAGDTAPDFFLQKLDLTQTSTNKMTTAKPPERVRLSELVGKQPVVLAFSSYT